MLPRSAARRRWERRSGRLRVGGAGRPTVSPPETWLTCRLKDPVTVDTTQSAQAFVPVSQYDYDNYGRRGSRYAGGYAPQGPYASAPYACGYDAPCYAPPAYA